MSEKSKKSEYQLFRYSSQEIKDTKLNSKKRKKGKINIRVRINNNKNNKK